MGERSGYMGAENFLQMKKLITESFIQIIPVMIGVYLGFAFNNFGEQRKLEKQKAVFQQMNDILAFENGLTEYNMGILENF